MRKKGSNLILIMVFGLCLALAFPLKSFSSPGRGRNCYLDSGQATPGQKEMGPRQRFGDNLALLRLLRMTRALDLTEEQAARIFPMANRIEKEKMELNRQLNQEIRELRSLVEASTPDEARIKEKVARIKEIRESIRLKEAEFDNFLEKNLTVVQRGKYVLFNLEFAQFLSRNLERIRNLQGQPARPPIKKTPEK
jgi:Spy/CpxP family protein refolding chaperone